MLKSLIALVSVLSVINAKISTESSKRPVQIQCKGDEQYINIEGVTAKKNNGKYQPLDVLPDFKDLYVKLEEECKEQYTNPPQISCNLNFKDYNTLLLDQYELLAVTYECGKKKSRDPSEGKVSEDFLYPKDVVMSCDDINSKLKLEEIAPASEEATPYEIDDVEVNCFMDMIMQKAEGKPSPFTCTVAREGRPGVISVKYECEKFEED